MNEFITSAEMNLAISLIGLCGFVILIIRLFSLLENIAKNTANISNQLEYLIERFEQNNAATTLDEIEKELTEIQKNQLTNTRR